MAWDSTGWNVIVYKTSAHALALIGFAWLAYGCGLSDRKYFILVS
jgi:hypothetical protein